MHRGFVIVAVIPLTSVLLLQTANPSWDIPRLISYQGKVTDSSGVPISDGTYSMQFKIFDASTGNLLLWSSGGVSVDVTDGVFSVALGQSPQPGLDLAFDQDAWLEVIFEGETQSPRQQICSSGYAFMASGLVPGTEVVGEISEEPSAIIKTYNTSVYPGSHGLYGETISYEGAGVYGVASLSFGVNCGVYGETVSEDGRGVSGVASSPTGICCGVYAENASTDGRAVYAIATATSGATYGLWGRTSSPYGGAVLGMADCTIGDAWGVRGETEAPDGAGLCGVAGSDTGVNFGVYAVSSSPEGYSGYFVTRCFFGDDVGIGVGSPAFPLNVAGAAHASSFPTSSDARLKKNVVRLHDVLGRLESIRGVSFEWNERYEAMGRSTGHREIGVIAQEVEAQFPELVTKWGDDKYRAVDYGRLTGILIEAVKELHSENRSLQQRVAALEREILKNSNLPSRE